MAETLSPTAIEAIAAQDGVLRINSAIIIGTASGNPSIAPRSGPGR